MGSISFKGAAGGFLASAQWKIDDPSMLRTRRLLGCSTALALALSLCSCAGVPIELTRPTVDTAVGDVLAAAAQEQNKAQLRALLDDETVDHVAKKLVAALTTGLVDALSEGEGAKAVDALVARLVRVATAELATGLKEDLAPAFSATLSTLAEDAAQGAMSKPTEDAISRIARRTGAAFSDAVVNRVALSLDEVGRGKVGEDLRRELGEALTAELETVRPALAKVARDMVKEGMAGAADEMRGDFGAAVREQVGADAKAVEDVVSQGLVTLEHAVGFLVGLMVSMVALLAFAFQRVQHHRRRADEALRAASPPTA